MTNPPWSVVLLEDDKDTRRFFESCVRSHARLTLSASFAPPTPGRTWFESNTADVLLTDLALPDGHGLTLIRELADRQPGCDILVVSVFGDEDTVIACAEAGGGGYTPKQSAACARREVIRRRAAGPFPHLPDDCAQAARPDAAKACRTRAGSDWLAV